MKKLMIVLTIFFLIISLSACDSNSDTTVPILTVSSPTNVRITGSSISWNNVENATDYIVVIGSTRYTVTGTTYNLENVQLSTGSHIIRVIARVGSTESSPSSSVTYAVLEKIEYLSGDRILERIQSDSLYRFFFAFLNASEQRMAANASIDIRIVNSLGVEVYKKTHTVTKSDYNIWTWSGLNARTESYTTTTIPFSQITAGNSSSGKLYFKISAEGNVNFNELEINIAGLPINFSLQIPTLPLEVSTYSGSTLRYKTNITNITYDYSSTQTLTVRFDGTKTYDSSGNNYARTAGISVRLLRADGVVIDTKTFYTPSLMVGESFINQELKFYNLPPGDYRIEIIKKQN
jgi:hypothetical protein